MQVRLLRAAILVATITSLGAGYRTPNFIVSARSAAFAKKLGNEAERLRRDLAIEWLGKELPSWSEPCPIRVKVGDHLGAGGATSFMFRGRHPFGWRMSIQGSHERLLDSVLPHEITHTIFATHFGRPLPRWADEGACTTVEHVSERRTLYRLLIRYLQTERGISFTRMFALTEYPRDVRPLYAQGYSVVKFLLAQGGKKKFVDFLGEGMDERNWAATTQRHYGYRSLRELQDTWLVWLKQGSPSKFARKGKRSGEQPSDSKPPAEFVAASRTAKSAARSASQATRQTSPTTGGRTFLTSLTGNKKRPAAPGTRRRRRQTIAAADRRRDLITQPAAAESARAKSSPVKTSPATPPTTLASWYLSKAQLAERQRGTADSATRPARTRTPYLAERGREPTSARVSSRPTTGSARRVILEWRDETPAVSKRTKAAAGDTRIRR